MTKIDLWQISIREHRQKAFVTLGGFWPFKGIGGDGEMGRDEGRWRDGEKWGDWGRWEDGWVGSWCLSEPAKKKNS